VTVHSDVARSISTIAIWAAIAAILITFRVRGPEDVIVLVVVGMTGFLSVAAALGTFAIWRTERPAEASKIIHREL
jgi:hypothetical protein